MIHLLNCRGLAAVHAYDKDICHRDVKSFNFLVDSQFTVKIADLELGVLKSKDRIDPALAGRGNNNSELSGLSSSHNSELVAAMNDPQLIVVEELLANWMAPDVSLS